MKTRESKTVAKENETEVEKTNGKMKTLFMAVTARGGIILNQKQLPVFRRKKGARTIANKVQGKVVPVTVSW